MTESTKVCLSMQAAPGLPCTEMSPEVERGIPHGDAARTFPRSSPIKFDPTSLCSCRVQLLSLDLPTRCDQGSCRQTVGDRHTLAPPRLQIRDNSRSPNSFHLVFCISISTCWLTCALGCGTWCTEFLFCFKYLMTPLRLLYSALSAGTPKSLSLEKHQRSLVNAGSPRARKV